MKYSQSNKITQINSFNYESQLEEGRRVCYVQEQPRSWTRNYKCDKFIISWPSVGEWELHSEDLWFLTSVSTCFSQFSLTAMLKWWKIRLRSNLSELLYLSEGRSSQRNLSLASGVVPKLNEKHDGISRQANEHSGMLSTKSPPRAVMFK